MPPQVRLMTSATSAAIDAFKGRKCESSDGSDCSSWVAFPIDDLLSAGGITLDDNNTALSEDWRADASDPTNPFNGRYPTFRTAGVNVRASRERPSLSSRSLAFSLSLSLSLSIPHVHISPC